MTKKAERNIKQAMIHKELGNLESAKRYLEACHRAALTKRDQEAYRQAIETL